MIFVSVLLPTRNRCETLQYALQTVTSIDDDRLEIIVCDNASNDATYEIVLANGDPRIRYINPGERLGMSQNWEFALDHARGDWVGFLGDDDGLLPGALATLRGIIDETGAGAVRARAGRYLWPSLIGQDNGILRVPGPGKVRLVNGHKQLLKVLHGRASYLELPCLYNGGFAARQAIDKARSKTGRFFNSRIPDVYSGVVLSHVLPSFAFSETALALNGASIHSTGTSEFARPGPEGLGRPSAEFLREANLPFHPAVPLSSDGTSPKSLNAIVHESWYQASEIFADIPGVPAKQRLDAVLRTASPIDPIRQWASDYAEIHQLAPPWHSLPLAMQRRVFRATALLGEGWKGGWHSDFAPERSIRNVAEAAQLAAEVIHDPRRMSFLPVRNLARVGRRLVNGALG